MNKILSQLAHVELLSAKPEESVAFMRDVIGMYEVHREGQSVWLRGWGEWLHSSLIITESNTSGLGHAGWRAYGADELDATVAALKDAGIGEGWVDPTVGRGPAFRFRDPEGHLTEIFWEVELYEAPEELKAKNPNRPQKYFPHGAGVRRIDHVTLGGVDIRKMREFYQHHLGFRHMESFGLPDRTEMGAFLSTNHTSHDLGILSDTAKVPGRLNHLAFWVDSETELRRAADILIENECGLELGPERHAIGENFCLYTREPGGNRIELFTGPGYANYLPDWKAPFWDVNMLAGSYYERDIPMSFHKRWTPPLEGEVMRDPEGRANR